MTKNIGVLTSGGDCGGLNAVIRAITSRAINEYGWQVYGIKEGTLGMMKDPLDIIHLKLSHFDGNLMRMGGTFLGSNNKGNPFKYKQKNGTIVDMSDKIIQGFNKLKLDALIGIGGDGSMKILKYLTKKGKINQGSYGTSRLKSKTLKAKKKINQAGTKKRKKKSK